MQIGKGKDGCVMNYLLTFLTGENVFADDSGAKEALDGFTTKSLEIVQIVVYVLMGILVALLLIKSITTAMAVVKAADDPQVRQEKLSGFKYLAIGLGVGLVVLALLTTALALAQKYFTTATGK